MRVTKAIRDYIEKKVFDEYDKAKNELKKDYEKREERAKKEIKEMLESTVLENINIILNYYGMEQIEKEDAFNRFYMNIQNREEIAEINRKRTEIYVLAKDKITEILATLELGGTKEDLDKMLSEIKF